MSSSEIKSWLKSALTHEDLPEITSIDILGNSAKGDGYLGGIVFVHVSGTTGSGAAKDLQFVLKCSKKSQAARDQMPVQDAFLNEIFLYDTVLPAFRSFQLGKSLQPFESYPKYFGSFVDDFTEIVVLQNMKKLGYDVWDRTRPMTRRHVEMVVREYGRLHGLSAGMQEQDPEGFKGLSAGVKDVFQSFITKGNVEKLYSDSIEDFCDVLRGHLDQGVIEQWRDFKKDVIYTFDTMLQSYSGLKVITHGDCWNNNFMFLSSEGEVPLKVALIDWQISNFSTPIRDLSYFLFTCLSKEDLEDLDQILDLYYRTFAKQLSQLGSDASKIYPKEKFLEDWKRYCRYGILLFCVVVKICINTDSEAAPDLVESAEKGEDFMLSFRIEIEDKAKFRDRIMYVVKYAVKNNLINDKYKV